MHKIWIVLLLLGCESVFAMQSQVYNLGSHLNFDISAKELTHIFVEDDRITGLKVSDDSLAIDKDEEQGHIFVKLKSEQLLPIPLFVTTEKGHTIGLRLSPKTIPAETIRIQTPKEILEKATEQGQSYQDKIVDLISALYIDREIEGYEILKLKSQASKVHNMVVQHLAEYAGNKFYGMVYSLKNTSKNPIELTEQDFYEIGVKAIAIEKSHILPNQSTHIYLVRDLF